MRMQKSPSGHIIDVVPKFLIVPPQLETTAEKLLAEITATETNNSNPFAGKLSLIVEPRLQEAPNAWYLVADPQQAEGLEYSHLAGHEGPSVETKEGWKVDGVEIKVRLDFGAGWVGYRGWGKSVQS